MFFGYNTNGFAHHRLEDAIAILAGMGYEGVAITVDYHALDPKAVDMRNEAERVRRLLRKHRLRCVIETGARFLLDPRHKHQPTLLTANPTGQRLRREFLVYCVELAGYLEADAVSFWSGTPIDAVDDETNWTRLVDGCRFLIDVARDAGVRLAFEPEPGMFVDTMARFEELLERLSLGDGDPFGLTLDVGHLHCQGELPIAEHIERWRDRLWNVHLDDMRSGVHDHLAFGEGEIDFAETLKALEKIDYAGGAYVELSRHSHDAVRVATRSLAFLNAKRPASRAPSGAG